MEEALEFSQQQLDDGSVIPAFTSNTEAIKKLLTEQIEIYSQRGL